MALFAESITLEAAAESGEESIPCGLEKKVQDILRGNNSFGQRGPVRLEEMEILPGAVRRFERQFGDGKQLIVSNAGLYEIDRAFGCRAGRRTSAHHQFPFVVYVSFGDRFGYI